MREIIYHIIVKHGYRSAAAANDIEGTVLRFIDWLAKEVTLKLVWHDGMGYTKEWQYLPDKWNIKGTTRKTWSLEELFEYWFQNIEE
jgi:hypothetical protein